MGHDMGDDLGDDTPAPVRIDYPSRGGVTIAAVRWEPAGPPRGLVQIAHGMGEHVLRYAPLAARLTAAGHPGILSPTRIPGGPYVALVADPDGTAVLLSADEAARLG